MDSLRIRPATADDALALARLLGQLGYPTDSDEIPARLQRLEARPGTTVIVAENADGVVGALTVHLFSSLHTSEPVAWLTSVVVEEKARGQGIGAALVKRAEDWAAQHGATRVSLTSALRRTRAHEFYQDLSYEHTGVRLTKILDAHSRTQSTSPGDEFHVVEFEHHDEAASFVAALSRLLESPALASGDHKDHKIEVWARSPVASEAVRLFLSGDALAAARSGFSPLPVARTVRRSSLPDESFLIIEGGVTPAWGAAEASAKLLTR
ncbi:MAG TPA: GNAT family N-acetyltransferase [Gemmatimonadaceae bacterium]|nr:GNAT family N-acetyltransferase [Gemmatimonadaceae bacterium]